MECQSLSQEQNAQITVANTIQTVHYDARVAIRFSFANNCNCTFVLFTLKIQHTGDTESLNQC